MSEGSSLGYLFGRLFRNLALGILVWLVPIFGFVGGVYLCTWIPPLPSHGSSDGSAEECGMSIFAEYPLLVFYALVGVLVAAGALAGFFAIRRVRDAFSMGGKARRRNPVRRRRIATLPRGTAVWYLNMIDDCCTKSRRIARRRVRRVFLLRFLRRRRTPSRRRAACACSPRRRRSCRT